MLAEIGYFTLLLSFLTAIYSIATALYGEMRHHETVVLSSRNAVIVTFVLLLISTGSLQVALLTQDYQIEYVWSVTSPDMPLFFRATALWGSQAGSLLFWTFLMSSFSALAVVLNWRTHRRLMPYAIAYMMAVLIFFIGLNLFLENPFNRWWLVPESVQEGGVISTVLAPATGMAPTQANLEASAKGLNPLLRHFGMAIHPPMLYLGFVAFIIPFAFAMSALASGDLSTNWIKASRRWSLVAWLFLSLGLILGGRWAYDVLGWGGYWGWDPVENAAFLPWLIGTAFLHSVMIQEKRGMLKTWNMFLAVSTFAAVIFGTFATRSGLVESVHSFARSGIGMPMFLFWLILTLISVGLILYRRAQGLLNDEHAFVSFFSRETLFVINNLVFMALFVAIFWGSFGAPIVSELFLDTDITLGLDYFYRVTPPLFLALYILMGIAPLSAWGTTSLSRLGKALAIPAALTAACVAGMIVTGITNIGALIGYGFVLLSGFVAIIETYRGYAARQKIHNETPFKSLHMIFKRNPRRYAGYMIHLGVTVIGIGVIGSTIFQQETQQTLAVGDSLSIDRYIIQYDRIDPRQIADDGRLMDIATVSIYDNGRLVSEVRPRRDYYPLQQQSMTIAGSYSTAENDVYILLVGWEDISAQNATFKVYINPLINLVWWGSLVLILGTALAVWPHEHAVRETAPEGRRKAKGATA